MKYSGKIKPSIEDVIDDMQSMDDHGGITEVFTEGYCYDFAYLLQRTFGGDIVYNKKDHYLLHVDGKFYDITGEVDPPDDFQIENIPRFTYR